MTSAARKAAQQAEAQSMARKAGCRRSVEEIMDSISKRYPVIMAHLAKAEQAEANRIGPGPDRPEAHQN